MSHAVKLPARMSVQEFLEWDSGDGLHYQLVDGEPRAMAPASITHGVVQARMAALLIAHLDRNKPSCTVVLAPGVVPRLLSDHNVRIPDVAVTCSPRTPEQRTLSDPLILIEILSPSNEADTWSNVWTYTSIPSVQEILVLHTDRIAAELLRRSPDGNWPERLSIVTDGDLVLESIALRVALSEVYQGTRFGR